MNQYFTFSLTFSLLLYKKQNYYISSIYKLLFPVSFYYQGSNSCQIQMIREDNKGVFRKYSEKYQWKLTYLESRDGNPNYISIFY